MIFTTSYKSPGMEELLTYLPMSVGAKKIVELGTQQGHSTLLLAKSGARVKTYDSFQTKYTQEPFKETHADMATAAANLVGYDVEIMVGDAFRVKPEKCDVLHIDICNHGGNIPQLLSFWAREVKKMIIIEGGGYNKWQKKYRFLPFNDFLEHMWGWNYIIIEGKGGYAMTVLTRK